MVQYFYCRSIALQRWLEGEVAEEAAYSNHTQACRLGEDSSSMARIPGVPSVRIRKGHSTSAEGKPPGSIREGMVPGS